MSSDDGEMVAVTELVEGDEIDLQGDPYADPGHGPGPHMDECTFQHETSVVCGEDGPGELEERDCYRLDFVHMGGERGQGFPPEHKVRRMGHVSLPETLDPARPFTRAEVRKFLGKE